MTLCRRTLALSALGMTALSGCEGWPPHTGDYESLVEQHRTELERIAAKLEGSGFDQVRIKGGYPGQPLTAIGYTFLEHGAEESVIDSDPEWVALFEKTGDRGAWARDGAYSFFYRYSHDRDYRRYYASVVYSPQSESREKVCKPEFRNLPCGRCSVPIDAQWEITYDWSPQDIGFMVDWSDPRNATEQEKDRVYALPYEEGMTRHRNARNACFRQAAEVIGFEFTEMPPPD